MRQSGSATSRHYGLARLGLGLLVIAIVSLGVHDLAIEHLGIPYPTLVAPPAWLPAAREIFRVASLVAFCLLARPGLARWSLVRSGIVVGVLSSCLSERLRVTIIEFALTHGWLDRRWLFILLTLSARVAVCLAEGFAAVLIARFLRSRRLLLVVAVLLAATAIGLAVEPAANRLAAWVQLSIGLVEPAELYQPPYNLLLNGIMYVTFLEPTVAAYYMAGLVLPELPGSKPARIGLFTLLILGATGRVTLLFLYSFWVEQPIGLAFLATGQFVAEMLVMAWLVGILWYGSRGDPSLSAPARRPAPN